MLYINYKYLNRKQRPTYNLSSADPLTTLARSRQIHNWEALLTYLRQLPYGRTSSRSDLSLVLTENRGTCSSKHALAKQLADLNKISGVELILAIYKMSEINTPGIGTHLSDNNLAYMPEAHSYLKVNGQRIDITTQASDVSKIIEDIVLERAIEADQVGDFKVAYRKSYIEQWRKDEELALRLDELWSIREQCIASLARSQS